MSKDPIIHRADGVLGFNEYVYVNNNPLRYVDPSGETVKEIEEQLKTEERSWVDAVKNVAVDTVDNFVDLAVDTANNLVDLVGGTSYSIMDNYTYGLYSKFNQPPQSTAGQIGQSIGDSITYATSVVEMFVGNATFLGGVGITGGGLALCPATVGGGCAAAAGEVAISAKGAVMAAHGGSVMMYTAGKGGSGGGESNNLPNKDSKDWVKLKGDQGWKDSEGNIWKKDKLHKDHWDISDKKGNKIKEVDYEGKELWPNGPKNKNKNP